jgi:hypothetical protein
MERVPGGDAFAAALIAQELREGHMTCLVFSSKTREIGIHFVRLLEKHRNAIRRLKIEIPGAEQPNIANSADAKNRGAD